MYSALAETVAVAPSCGLIYPGSHQILILRLNPTEHSPRQEFSIRLLLNAAENAMVPYIQRTQIRGKTTAAVFLKKSFQMRLLGVDSCPWGGKPIYVSGRRLQLVFPAYSGGLKNESSPSYQEPQSRTSAVG